MAHLQIGISALRAAQVALNNSAQNISNASTPGYSRQRIDFAERPGQLNSRNVWVGGGVEVAAITRLHDMTVQQSLLLNASGTAAANVQVYAFREIEQALTPADGSIHDLVTEFFNRVEQLATNPAESVLRHELIDTASQLADSISGVLEVFRQVSDGRGQEILDSVDSVNQLAEQISELTTQIRVHQSKGTDANSLLDQRDRLIGELATFVDIDPLSYLSGSDPLVAAGGALIIGEVTSQLLLESSPTGQLVLASSTGARGIAVTSGKIAGLVDTAHDATLGIQADFEEWASALLREIDTIQATGISLDGPSPSLIGQRQFHMVDVPLADSDAMFEITSGDFALTVTDPSGNRQTHVIEIDADRDSLRDIVSWLDAIGNISSAYNEDSHAVSIHAAPGYRVDLAGRPDQHPVEESISGTVTPTIAGTFLSNKNTTWNVEVLSSGEVGVSPEVLLRVTDAETGEAIRDFNAGLGFAANQPFEIADGVLLSLTTGTLNAGDSFEFQVTGQPDETGLAASLGLGTLFTGDSLRDLKLHPDLAASPAALAASRSGSRGEGRQLDRYIDLRLQTPFSGGTETFEEHLAALTGVSGILVNSLEDELTQRAVRQVQLETTRDTVSGVDPNEELLEMMQYQRAFQAASRFVTTIDQTLDDLMRLIG